MTIKNPVAKTASSPARAHAQEMLFTEYGLVSLIYWRQLYLAKLA